MKTIYAEDIQFNYEGGTGGDAGIGYYGRCPECKAEVKVTENQWWGEVCECGYQWQLNVKIEAEKDNKKEQPTK